MLEPEVESRPWPEQLAVDGASFREQLTYLLERSAFYRKKLAGHDPTVALAEIAQLPLTEKDELRATRTPENPFGTHLCAEPHELLRIYSTSGTTGEPSYIPLTAGDLDNWVTGSARSYAASGISAGQRIVSTYNAGPFVAGAALASFDRIGLCHIPVGTGNTDRLVQAIERLRPEAAVLTPSYAAYLAENHDLRDSSVERVLVAGEPGGGEESFRRALESHYRAPVYEIMGIGDIAASLWGECEAQAGMHFSAGGIVHVELIDPDSGRALPFEDGTTGELVYTHLRRQAVPLVRFRSRDHVVAYASRCSCGRSSLRVRCIGRTDDMLIVRGVNVFPAAVREVVARFAPQVTGAIEVRPRRRTVKQDPPLPVVVELADTEQPHPALGDAIAAELRAALTFAAEVRLVPARSLPRSEYKSKLLNFSEAGD